MEDAHHLFEIHHGVITLGVVPRHDASRNCVGLVGSIYVGDYIGTQVSPPSQPHMACIVCDVPSGCEGYNLPEVPGLRRKGFHHAPSICHLCVIIGSQVELAMSVHEGSLKVVKEWPSPW